MIIVNSFIFFLISSCLYFKVQGQPPTYDVNGILIEMASPLWQDTQCVNGVQHLTHVQYSTFWTTSKAYGISLIGYESVVQNSIYIKSSINKINTTHVEIECSCEQNTLFSKMKFSYIIIKDTIFFLQIYNDCFLCGDQDSLTGYRKWQFSARQHTTPFTNDIQISSSLSAFNVSNVEGKGIQFNISTKMKTTDKFIYHTIQAQQWTKVTSVCITTIIYDFSKTNILPLPNQPYQILVKTQTKYINSIDQATKIQPSNTCFQYPNSMYYGISAINILFTTETYQLLLFDLIKPQNLNFNFKSNQNLIDIQLSAFFIRHLDCPNTYFFDPVTYSCVPTCPPRTGPNPNTNYCQKCHQTCATCSGSGDNKCQTCISATVNNFRQIKAPLVAPNKCQCMQGYIEPTDGTLICLKCSQLIENCLQCTSKTFCSLCASNYKFNPLTNKCGCTNTDFFLSQGSCLTFAGCLTVQHSTNIQNFCSVCDENNNFEFVIENNTCRCKKNYTLNSSTQKCADLCGDGIVIDTQCDDGNNLNGDGCSSTCKLEQGFFCVGKNIQQPSLCMPLWNFQIDFLYSSRDISSNIGTFVFVMSPPQPKISGMNLIDCLSFSFPSSILSYEYDPLSGKLSVNVEFSESIEGEEHNFTVNMESVKIKTNKIKSSFEVNGMNSWLIRDQYSGIYKFVIYGILVVCFLAWIIAIVVSLMGYKHLGIQLVFPIQSIYLVLMQQSSNAPGLRALDLMKFINGYNSIDGIKLKQITSIDDTRYFSLQYLQNLNYFIIVNTILIIIMFILKSIYFNKQKRLNEQQLVMDVIIDEQKREVKKCKNKTQLVNINQMYQQRIQCQQLTLLQHKQKLKPIQNIIKYTISRFSIVIILFIIQSSIYYLGVYMIFTNKQEKFSILLNNLISIICVGIGLFALWMYPGFKDNQIILIINSKLKYNYTKLYIIWYMIFAVLLVFLQSFTIKGLLLIPIIQMTLTIVILIIKNPYNKQQSRRPRFILPIIQQIILSTPLYLLWITGFLNTLDPQIYFITTVLIITCCLLAIIITCIKVFFQWKYFTLLEIKTNLENIEENQLNQKDKLTHSNKDQKVTNQNNKDQDQNNIQYINNNNNNEKKNKDYETIIKQKHTINLKDLPNDKINTFSTNKKKSSHNNNGYDSVSSNQDNNEEDLQMIKKRLRTDLKTKRGIKHK